ncbi:MAG: acylphosphatase [Pirellulaceae bacterium]
MERRVIHYVGRVQGVGFRYTSHRIAQRYPVDGYVQNLPDGRVLMVVEGEATVLDQLQAEVDQVLGQYIRQTNVDRRNVVGDCEGFLVRY